MKRSNADIQTAWSFLTVANVRKSSLIALATTVLPIGGLYWLLQQDPLYSNEMGQLREVVASTELQVSQPAIQTERICNFQGLPPRIVCSNRELRVVVKARERAEIRYPRAMQVNQSRDIRLNYWVELHSATDPLDRTAERSVTVSGAGLEVEPSETRKLEGQRSTFWSIRAEGTGPHNIVVNTAQLFRFSHPSLTVSDGSESKRIDATQGEFVLPIMVYTVWNIPDWAATLIAWAVGLVAFVLTLPFLQDLLGRSIDSASDESAKGNRNDASSDSTLRHPETDNKDLGGGPAA